VLHLARVASGDVSADPDVVDLRSIRLGIALAEWFAHEGLRIYAVLSESDADRARRRLIEAIHERLGGRATVRDVMRRGPRSLRGSADDAKRALDDLVAHDLAHWEGAGAGSKGGRPTDVLVLDVNRADEAEDPGDTTPGEPMPVVSPPPTGGPFPSSHPEVVSPPLPAEGGSSGELEPKRLATEPSATRHEGDASHPLVTQPREAWDAEPPSDIAERCLVEAIRSGRESDVRASWNVLARHTSPAYATEVEIEARQALAGGADAA
jgi:hypothetical protein